MRLIIERNELLKALTHVASVVERRNTIPILSNLLIAASGKTVKFTATDLDIEVVESAPADVSAEGATTVSANIIHDIVRKLADGAQVELSLGPDEGRMALTSGPAKFALPVLPPDDFPDLSAGDMSHAFEITAEKLQKLIDKTRFAISSEETRYYLNGIYLHAPSGDDEGSLRAVATDGHRLAQIDMPLPKGAEGMPGVIVPRKTVAEVRKLIEDTEKSVKVELSDSKIRFLIGDVVLTSQLIDGTFPDYGRVIPEGNDKVLSVSNDDFTNAVNRVSTLSSDKGRAVKLKMAQGTLTLSVNNPDSGSATEELKADYSADELEIGFNARYLLDISNQLESDNVKLLLSDPGSPTMVRDDDDTSALYVLMPMRV